jgi:hypothetical protein
MTIAKSDATFATVPVKRVWRAVIPLSNGEPDCAWAAIGRRSSGRTTMPRRRNRRACCIELLGTMSESLFRIGHLQQPKDQLRYGEPSADLRKSPMTFFRTVMLERNTASADEIRIQSRSRDAKHRGVWSEIDQDVPHITAQNGNASPIQACTQESRPQRSIPLARVMDASSHPGRLN